MNRRKSPNRQMAELAMAAIADMEFKTVFVKVERIMRRKSMEPTDNQMKLYRFIKKRGFCPIEWTLGMNWQMLGGLKARGRVKDTVKDGKEGVIAV
jgi:hypothetical protein